MRGRLLQIIKCRITPARYDEGTLIATNNTAAKGERGDTIALYRTRYEIKSHRLDPYINTRKQCMLYNPFKTRPPYSSTVDIMATGKKNPITLFGVTQLSTVYERVRAQR